MVNLVTKVLVTIGSAASVGFGIWHFTVPKTWSWYSYIDPKASELILAVNAINIFFSLSLVLFGLMNALLILGSGSNRYSMAIVLGASCVLWLARAALQLARPQGSMSPALQYSMTAAFIAVLLCYAVSLVSVLASRDL
jgi:hypothetical protein